MYTVLISKVFPVTPHSQCINLVSNEKKFGHNHIWYHFFCQGMSVFFPDISGNPCMASFSELEYLLTGMMENPPDKKGFIKGLGISVPCYRRDDIKVIFGQSMKVSMEISQQTVIQINTPMCLVKFNNKKFFFLDLCIDFIWLDISSEKLCQWKTIYFICIDIILYSKSFFYFKVYMQHINMINAYFFILFDPCFPNNKTDLIHKSCMQNCWYFLFQTKVTFKGIQLSERVIILIHIFLDQQLKGRSLLLL